MSTILVIDDQDRHIDLCRRAIPEHTYLGPARCWKEAVVLLRAERRNIDVVLLDVNFDIPAEQLIGLPPDADERTLSRVRRRQGLEILARLRRGLPDLPVLLMTAREEVELSRAAERLGVEEYTWFLDDDYVDARSLRVQLSNILSAGRGVESEGPIYWGRTPGMRRVRARLAVLARGRLPVILAGPTGSGKSLLARHYIHPRSTRKGKFVALDLSTVPRELQSAHLFGSARGAYTGSIADRKGAFEEADGGTLFLDEIGNLPEDAQKMLLGVLQESTVTRIGDTQERKVDVKLIVATHEDLGRMVRDGRFRADLYMRLNPACTVQLLPMHARRGDLVGLLEWTARRVLTGSQLASLVAEYRQRAGLTVDGGTTFVIGGSLPPSTPGHMTVYLPNRTLALLRAYRWPGNLRELAMTVENALTFTFAELSGLPLGGRGDLVMVRPKLVRDLLRAVRVGDEAPADGVPLTVNLKPQDTLNGVSQDVERQYFVRLWEQEDGDFAAIARVLLGDAAHARKVQLRFNQLGLKVRELRASPS